MVAVDTIGIFLADDHAMVREGLAALVETDKEIEVIGQCGDGLKVVTEVLACNPDVVILDITLPGLNGLDICRELVHKCDGISILVLTMHSNEQFIAQALENGATGYLLKESAAEKLTEAIKRVAAGEIFLGPGIPRNVLQKLGQIEKDPYQKLSTRERQVLQLIAEGKTNRVVAEVLELSTKTVDTHRTRLMRKLNIHDQTSLVKFAIRKGIISVGE